MQRAFDGLGLDAAQRRLLLHSFRELTVEIPLQVAERGQLALRTFTGYRVQHNHARGPFKGGCATIPGWRSARSGRWRS